MSTTEPQAEPSRVSRRRVLGWAGVTAVVAGTGLLAGTPRPEAGRQVVEFAHGLPSSRGSADDPSNGNVCATLPVASPYRLTCRARTQLPAQMVTNSLHGRNINFLTGTASWWERLPTFSPV